MSLPVVGLGVAVRPLAQGRQRDVGEHPFEGAELSINAGVGAEVIVDFVAIIAHLMTWSTFGEILAHDLIAAARHDAGR